MPSVVSYWQLATQIKSVQNLCKLNKFWHFLPIHRNQLARRGFYCVHAA